MCKRFCGTTIGLIALALVGGYVLFGNKLGGYIHVLKDRVMDSAKDSIPLDVELDRTRKEIQKLEKDIDAKRSGVAEAEYEVKKVAREIAALRSEVADNRIVLLARAREIDAATGHVKVGGELVSVEEAKRNLDREFSHWEARKQSLERAERTLKTRDRKRAILHDQYKTLIAQKAEMESLVEELELAIEELELQQMESEYQDDNSRLADIKQSIHESRKRIEVLKETHKLKVEYMSGTESVRSVDEILQALGDDSEFE